MLQYILTNTPDIKYSKNAVYRNMISKYNSFMNWDIT